MKISESSRIRVWASITLMVALYASGVYWVYRESSKASESIARLVPLATGLAVVPLVLVTLLAIFSMLAKSIRYVARVRAVSISPEIRNTLASVSVGDGDRERLRWLSQHHRRPFEIIFTEFLSSFGGQINSELRILAVELGLAERWRHAIRSRNFLVQKTALANLGRIGHAIDPRLLRHPVEQTRIEAACALLASGSTDAPAQVFKMLPDQSLLGRIRLAALPVLRYGSQTEQEAAQEVFDLLQFPDEQVHAPAAKAAADMGISESIPLLVKQLRGDGPVSALAAARALAEMGSEGRDLLENEIYSSARPQYALQALEQSLVAERG